MTAPTDPSSISSDLDGLWGGRVWRFDELPSTNSWALDHAHLLGHGDVVWTLSQTAGRGRLGRSWWALPGKCLTLSIILCSPSYAALGPNLGQLAACAVRDVLDHYGLRACLKWPNDIMVSDRKIAGILVDQDPGRPFYVVGMGLNVNLTAAELAGAGIDRPATSMHDATGREFRASDVLRTLLDKLALRMAQAETTGLRPLWEIWAQNDWLEHRSIRVVGHETQLEGEYLGVDEVGRLKLRTPDGEERALWTGDVEQVRSLGVDQAFAGRPLGVLKTG